MHGAEALDTGGPDIDGLRRLLERRDPPIRTASGLPLRIVEQERKPAAFEEGYEARVYLEGGLQVRRGHWHDHFNVLAWLAYPRAKAALNARHYAALQSWHGPNRGPARDALTLFDESGVVMAAADGDLLQMVRDFRWKTLFWENRARLRERVRFFLFGHALYEKMLRPYAGITGRAILLDADPALLAAPLPEQLAAVDERVAGQLSGPAGLESPRDLAVLPVLGVPGWHADGERESFYDDTEYFRPGRLREKRDK